MSKIIVQAVYHLKLREIPTGLIFLGIVECKIFELGGRFYLNLIGLTSYSNIVSYIIENFIITPFHLPVTLIKTESISFYLLFNLH